MANRKISISIGILLTAMTLLLFLFSPSVYAATCGNNVAEGNEECDGSDIREYSCDSIDDFSSPYYNKYVGTGSYGTLSCKTNCEFSTSGCYNLICGDGIIRGLEECDDGSSNSDSQPNACRTDCTQYKCGDGVTDTGEECDEGSNAYSGNDDRRPNECRTDCREPWCGDGVLDFAEGEECDPAILGTEICNNQCIECYDVEDDLHISKSGKLCYYNVDEIEIADNGEEGVLIIDDNPTGETVILDCGGVKLVGSGMATYEYQGPGGPALQGPILGGSGDDGSSEDSSEPQESNIIVRVWSSLTSLFFGSFVMAQPSSNALMGQGTGIKIVGSNVVLINCEVENYRTGIKVVSTGAVLSNNKACGNSMDISADDSPNYGTKNTCDRTINWMENGVNGCTFSCDGTMRTQTECPECVCQCPTCEEIQPSSTTTSTRRTTTTTSTTTTTLPIKLCSSNIYPRDFELCKDDCPRGTECTKDCTCIATTTTTSTTTTMPPTKLCSSKIYPKGFETCKDDCPKGTECTKDCTCIATTTTTTRLPLTRLTSTTTTTFPVLTHK